MSPKVLTRWLLVAACALAHRTAAAADFYVAPNGSPSGNGSIGSPWDLQTALNQPSSVHAGDTIWLRGGTYTGHFTSNLNGSSSSPIIVRQYAGERATIDGYYDSSTNPAITVDGSYTWFWGFEVMNSSPNRTTNNGGNTPPPAAAPASTSERPGTKLINLIVHDNSQGLDLWEAATNAEANGNLIYYNGWDDEGTRGSGHGIYVQGVAPDAKKILDNILFEGFSYGIHGYAEGGHLDNFLIQGNTSFDNGGLSQIRATPRTSSSEDRERRAQPDDRRQLHLLSVGRQVQQPRLRGGLLERDGDRQLLHGRPIAQARQLHPRHHDRQLLLRNLGRVLVVHVPRQHLLLVATDRRDDLCASEHL